MHPKHPPVSSFPKSSCLGSPFQLFPFSFQATALVPPVLGSPGPGAPADAYLNVGTAPCIFTSPPSLSPLSSETALPRFFTHPAPAASLAPISGCLGTPVLVGSTTETPPDIAPFPQSRLTSLPPVSSPAAVFASTPPKAFF